MKHALRLRHELVELARSLVPEGSSVQVFGCDARIYFDAGVGDRKDLDAVYAAVAGHARALPDRIVGPDRNAVGRSLWMLGDDPSTIRRAMRIALTPEEVSERRAGLWALPKFSEGI